MHAQFHLLQKNSALFFEEEEEKKIEDGVMWRSNWWVAGFVDADALTTGGKIFAIAYAIFGIPLALLYLGQCSKIVAGLLPGDRVLAAAFSAIFLTAIIYDIAEDSEDDTVRVSALLLKKLR